MKERKNERIKELKLYLFNLLYSRDSIYIINFQAKRKKEKKGKKRKKRRKKMSTFNFMAATANVTPYPSNRLNRSTNFKTLFDTTLLPYNKMYDNCKNTLCYTKSENYIYKPHSAYGMVGTSAAAYLGRRFRL
jgi:hypothetical protein